jgi:hypothetical protein
MSQIRVAQVATGNAGMLTLRQLISDARFELVAVSTSNPDKIGKDAGELAGLDVVTGIAAVGSLDALIASKPDAVVYCAMGDTRPVEATNDVRTLLEAGIDVVGSAPGTLQFPWGTMPQKVIDKVEASAQAGGASVYITGVDPGWATDIVPLALASTCQRIEQIKTYELADYATYDGAEVMFDLMGFGHPVDTTPMLFLPGVLGLAWGTAIRMTASALGIEVDEIVEFWEAEPAPETYEIAAGTIEKGTIAALHFSITGMVDGPRRSWSSTSPAPATTCVPTGPARRRGAAPTASRSPVNRTTSWTWCPAASTAITTMLRSLRRAVAS